MDLIFLAPLNFAITVIPPVVNYDEYWDNVSLLLHMDGPDGGTVFTEETGLAATVGAGVTTSTLVSKFGSSVGKFTAAATSRLEVPYSSKFSFEGDFTAEAWVYPTQTSVPNDDGWGRQAIIHVGTIASSSSWILEWSGTSNTSKFAYRWMSQGASTQYTLQTTAAFALNQWYHVAVTRSGTTVRIFVNGVLQGTATIAQASTCVGSGQLVSVGRWNYQYKRNFVGYLDEVRVTKGLARYTANFNVPTESFAST